MACTTAAKMATQDEAGGLHTLPLRNRKIPRAKRQPLRFNGALFVVLFTIILLHDVIQILGIMAADYCVGHKNYWLGLNAIGWSIYDTLLLAYLLCALWALIDVVMQVWFQGWHQKVTLFLSSS
ncbi:hypothetical protein [Marinicella meishanensis]|uniref:hypothetical protein n=1 Tax=Marinicella meishanensis TaxID=2873263 RepID=UPI001CBEAB24|nr:hypothetical protein [Marinicella sp. NBU2979]